MPTLSTLLQRNNSQASDTDVLADSPAEFLKIFREDGRRSAVQVHGLTQGAFCSQTLFLPTSTSRT